MALNFRGGGSLMLNAAMTLREERMKREAEERQRQAELQRLQMQQDFTAGQNQNDIEAQAARDKMLFDQQRQRDLGNFQRDDLMNQTRQANEQTATRTQQQQEQQRAIETDRTVRALAASLGYNIPEGGGLLTKQDLDFFENKKQMEMQYAVAYVVAASEQNVLNVILNNHQAIVHVSNAVSISKVD